nr:hypothetical protein [Tanacetum cinerariifolium]
MPPKMTTRSAGRLAAALRGGGTGGRASKGGGRTRGRYGDRSNSGIDGQGGQGGGQGSQGSDQGNGRNQNSDAVNDKIEGNVRNVIENNDLRGCTYKEFLACNQKEYDGKGGATVYTHWIKKMESVQNMSGCRDNQKVKYTARSFVDFKTLTREEFCPSYEMQKLENGLWNHAMVEAGHAAYRALRNGSIKKNPEKRGNKGEPSKDRNGREDNNRTRTENAFDTTANPVRRENTACPRLKQAQRPRGNHQNLVVAVNEGEGHRNNGTYNLRVATPRALVHAGHKTSGDARSWYMIIVDAKSWVVIVLHIFTAMLHNCPLFEILAHRLGFLQTYELTNILVEVVTPMYPCFLYLIDMRKHALKRQHNVGEFTDVQPATSQIRHGIRPRAPTRKNEKICLSFCSRMDSVYGFVVSCREHGAQKWV